MPHLPGGEVPRDTRGPPQCGLQILQAQPIEPGRWDGRIADPSDGTTWHCTLRLEGQGRLDGQGVLKLRGYVLTPLLGSTQTWTPYAGTLGADCSMK